MGLLHKAVSDECFPQSVNGELIKQKDPVTEEPEEPFEDIDVFSFSDTEQAEIAKLMDDGNLDGLPPKETAEEPFDAPDVFSFSETDQAEIAKLMDDVEEKSDGLPERETENVPDSEENKVFLALQQAVQKFGPMQGIVLEGEDAEDTFTDRITSMASGFAAVSEIKTGRFLLLGNASLDGGLLSHRLSASGRIKTLFSFSAEEPGEAFTMLKPYL